MSLYKAFVLVMNESLGLPVMSFLFSTTINEDVTGSQTAFYLNCSQGSEFALCLL